MNLYAYVHNNPFYYKDLDGQFAFVVPLLIGVFGTGGITISAPNRDDRGKPSHWIGGEHIHLGPKHIPVYD